MLFIKQSQNISFMLLVLCFFLFGEAHTTDRSLTPLSRTQRRLLKPTEVTIPEEPRSSNSVRVVPAEGVHQQNLVDEFLDEEMHGRRKLRDHIFKVEQVWVNGREFREGMEVMDPSGLNSLIVRVRMKDNDQSCPGCFEQVYVALVNLDTKEAYSNCYSLGMGDFGRRDVDFWFHDVKPARYGFGIVGAWEYGCFRGGFKELGVFNHYRRKDSVGTFNYRHITQFKKKDCFLGICF